jgi:hypothetical protein
MFTTDPHHVLVLAHERAHRLREEAALERLYIHAGARHVVAASLRRLADRLDAALVAPRPA